MIFTDTITLYTHKTTAGSESWDRHVIKGVQWSDKNDKSDNGGRISVARYITITFPEGTYEDIRLEAFQELDAIFYGEISDEITTVKGSRLSDILSKYPKSGRIKTVNDNSNRRFLKNKKVVIG